MDVTPAQREGSDGTRSARVGRTLLFAVVVGLAVRGLAVWLAPQHAFLYDHIDYMVWSEWAVEHGPTRLYDLPEHELVNVRFPPSDAASAGITPYPGHNPCDYPPLSGYIFWMQGLLWHVTDREVLTLPVGPDLDRYAEFHGKSATSRVVNTVPARAVNAAVPILADLLLAWGVLRLVGVLRKAARVGRPELAAFTITWLAPPVFLNSAFWTQMDSCVTCLLVWCVYLLASGRFGWSGLCYGAALMVKAQAILLAPVFVFVFIALRFRRGGSWRRAAQLWKTLAATVVIVAALAAPYAIAGRGHPQGGWLRWCERSFVAPIRRQYPYTTIKALNVWWLDFLLQKQAPRALNPASPTLGGVSKQTAGQIALTLAIVISAGLSAWRWRWATQAWIAFAFLVLLGAFVWPTRVHERYFYYCLPFLIAMAFVYRRWIPVLVALLVVGTFEVTWFLWLAPPSAAPDAPAQSRPAAVWSLLLALLTLASFVYAWLALLPWPARTRAAHEPPRTASSRPLFGEA